MLPQSKSLESPSSDDWETAMRCGDFERAWRISDEVLKTRDPATRDDPTQPYHLRWVWDGRPVDGRDVLVRCYHGLGDTIQFCRFLAPLRERARRVTVEIQPELIDLLCALPGPDRLIPFCPERPLPQSECDLEIMELSHALRLAPTPTSYLPMPARHGRGAIRVGVCWRSSPTWLPSRSLCSGDIEPLLTRTDVQFVNLQRGGPPLPRLPDDCPASIVETAHRITGLDLVISADTMVAHLTGALGVPLWLLLKADPDWRWLAGGNGSLWYPNVRKFRQEHAGEWGPVISAVDVTLAEMLGQGTLV